MSHKEQTNSKPVRKHGYRRAFKRILFLLTCIVLLIFFGVPLYLSSAGGTRFLFNKINASVDGQVQADDFSMGWFKGVKLTNLSYADSAGNTAVSINNFHAHPKYTALLSGKIKLGKTVVDNPNIQVKVPAVQPVSNGPEQVQSTSPTQKPPTESGDLIPVLPVHQIDLELINGSATIELADRSQKLLLTNIASKVQFNQADASGAMDVAMNINNDASVSTKGNVDLDKTGWTIQGGEFDVKVSKLQIADLKPLFALAGEELDMAGELNADMTVAIEDNAVRQLKGNAVISNFEQGGIVFTEPLIIDADVSEIEEGLQIKTLKVQSQFCRLDCTGTQTSLDYSIDADLKQTQRFVGQFTDIGNLSMAGLFSAHGKAGFGDDVTTISGNGDLKQFQIQKAVAATAVTDAQLDFDFALDDVKQQLRITRVSLTGTPGTVKLSNVIVPMSEQADKMLSMDIAAVLEMQKAWPFAQILLDDFYDIEILGQVDTACSIKTSDNQIHLLTENTTADNLRITIPDTEPFVQDKVMLKADILLDTDNKTIDIRKLDVEGARGEALIKVTKGAVKKKISNAQTRINGDFEVEYDWQAVSAFAAPYLPEGLHVRGKRKDAFHFESVYPTARPEQMTENLNGGGSLGFEAADYFGLNFGPTALNLNIQKGVVNFEIPPTTVNEGILQIAGKVDLNEQPRFLRLTRPMQVLDKIHINDTMTRLLLIYTNPIYVDATKASGIASFSCRQMAIPLSGEDKNRMLIDGTFQVDQLKMRAGSFTKQLLALFDESDTVMMTVRPTDFLLKNGFLSYQDMQIDVEDNPLNFRGRIGLDQSLAMSVQLPWTIGLDSVKTDRPAQQERIIAPIKGTLSKPELDTTRFLEIQGRMLIEQEVRKQLERLLK